MHKASVLTVLLIILPFVVPFAVGNDRFLMTVIVQIFIWGILACAWNILGGYGGQLSFGHGAFFGIGAYTSTILLIDYGVSSWLGMIVGAVLAGGYGLAISYPAFRTRGLIFGMVTLMASLVLELAFSYFEFFGQSFGIAIPVGSDSVLNLQFRSLLPYYYISLGFLVVTVLTVKLLIRSQLGYFLRAIRDDQAAAEALGVNPLTVKLKAMFISAFLAAVAGTLYAQFNLYISPETTFGFIPNLQIVLLTLVGGIGTLLGPIIGSAVSIAAGNILNVSLGYSPAVQPFAYGLLLVLIMLFEPRGIMGIADRVKHSTNWRNIAKRKF